MDCDWNSPGSNPFRGNNVEQAVKAYGFDTSTTSDLLFKLKSPSRADAVVFITKNGIVTNYGEASNLRDMYFGKKLCAGKVDVSRWSEDKKLPALIYCSNNNCLLVPIVCGNISRVDFRKNSEIKKPEVLERIKVQHVPEPSTIMLVIAGLLALVKKYRLE